MARRTNELNIEELSIVTKNKTVKEIDFNTALKLFTDDCKIRNLRNQTIKYYQNELSMFYKILKENEASTNPSGIRENDIKQSILWMKEKGLRTVTINTRLRAIKSFFNFLQREKYIKNNPSTDVKLLKDRRKVVETFSDEQLDQLFKQPNLRTFVGVRDYTFMMLLLDTGIRVSELEGVCIHDILWKEHKLHVRKTKNGFERIVPISDKMKIQLEKYIQIRGVAEDAALFLTLDSNAMSKRQYQNRVTYYGKKAELEGVRCSCHTFRHTFAKKSVMNGAGIFELQQILGHSSMEMVKVYVNLFSNDVADKHKSFSPLNNFKTRM